ncbi:unnamed protein product, partial [Musa textilis]
TNEGDTSRSLGNPKPTAVSFLRRRHRWGSSSLLSDPRRQIPARRPPFFLFSDQAHILLAALPSGLLSIRIRQLTLEELTLCRR